VELTFKGDAVHIIVDGYNLIRQSGELRRFEKRSLEEGRQALIQKLMRYKKQKGYKVTVVFDGWEAGPFLEERDRQGGIDIIYSQRGEKADEVIKRLVEHLREEVVVVTSDRDVASFTERIGGTGISSLTFEAKMEKISNLGTGNGMVDNDRDEKSERVKGKKGPSRRLSRKKRMVLAKMDKL
jgi:hypothetical protein